MVTDKRAEDSWVREVVVDGLDHVGEVKEGTGRGSKGPGERVIHWVIQNRVKGSRRLVYRSLDGI